MPSKRQASVLFPAHCRSTCWMCLNSASASVGETPVIGSDSALAVHSRRRAYEHIRPPRAPMDGRHPEGSRHAERWPARLLWTRVRPLIVGLCEPGRSARERRSRARGASASCAHSEGLKIRSTDAPQEPRRHAEVNEPPHPRVEPLPASARAQSGELVSVGRRGL